MFGHATYLIFELSWGLPVLALQWVAGHRLLRRALRPLLLAIGISTAYLSLADSVAIGNGIWLLHSNRIVDVRLGDLPLEEVIFFALTSTMVAQTVAIVTLWRRA